ncbi:hypothetical protein U1Q18_051433 [Sarracenia purpurea var. burkii]
MIMYFCSGLRKLSKWLDLLDKILLADDKRYDMLCHRYRKLFSDWMEYDCNSSDCTSHNGRSNFDLGRSISPRGIYVLAGT